MTDDLVGASKKISAKEAILKKTYVASIRPKLVVSLETQLEGFSEDEVERAWKELIEEGKVYVCRVDKWVKKV